MKLEIKEPCHENWDNMKIGLISRHCEVCDKGVMDFTKMNRGEIITYILSNPNDNVCGRLNKDQFDFHHDDIPILIEALRKRPSSNAFLIMALVCLSLSSCSDEPARNIDTPPAVKDKIEVVDSTQNDHLHDGDEIIAGEIEAQLDPQEKPIEPEFIVRTKGEVAVAGGICVVDPPEPDEPVVEPPQVDPTGSDEVADQIYQFPDKMPEYKGGMDALYKFIKSEMKYPDFEKENGIEGNVYVRFVIEKEGGITQIEILKSVNGSKNLDNEVRRVIGEMQKWNPAVHDKREVRAYMTLPFRFKLNE